MSKKLLTATLILDQAVTDAATLIYTTLNSAGLNVEFTFYLYQDFSSSIIFDPDKDRIGKVILKKKDFVDAGYTADDSPKKIVHFIRSKLYQKLAEAGTLKYFNKIIFRT
jgi:hypothetical protein